MWMRRIISSICLLTYPYRPITTDGTKPKTSNILDRNQYYQSSGLTKARIESTELYPTVKTTRRYLKKRQRYGDSNFYIQRHLASKLEVGVAKWRHHSIVLDEIYEWHKFGTDRASVAGIRRCRTFSYSHPDIYLAYLKYGFLGHSLGHMTVGS